MSKRTLIQLTLGLLGANFGLTGYHTYTLHQLADRNMEEMEARMDEIEGTLRGHIGLIEDSLKRIEDRALGKEVKGGWGQGMSEEAEASYTQRGKDSRQKK